MAKKELTTASVLAFERKLEPSDALLFAGTWEDQANGTNWPAIAIREKSVRGTISNRLKAAQQDIARLDAAIQNPNLQTVDIAALPAQADTLLARFTLRVLSGAGTPSACNNADYLSKLRTTIEAYTQSYGFTVLASRYAQNLANARFLWRNRMGAEQITTKITHMVDGRPAHTWTFNSLDISIRDFDASHKQLAELVSLIDEGLRGDKHVLLDIQSYARLGFGQEAFPSQELILERGKDRKSKTLYQVDEIAAIHSQKISNAIRTIDTWYPPTDEQIDMGPIAIEPYGSVTTQGKAYRQPKDGQDFYNLLDNWLLRDKLPAPEQQHFVIAMLIRGGVFGDAS